MYKNLFDIVAPLYDIMHFGAQKTFREMESIVSFESPDKVLDLGGGTGRIAKLLIDKVQSVTVVDSSKEMVKQCQQKYPRISCIHAAAENLPLAKSSINKILMVDAFHHFRSQEQVIKKVKRVLVQKGKVLIEEFNPTTIGGLFVVSVEKILRMGSIFHTPQSFFGVTLFRPRF